MAKQRKKRKRKVPMMKDDIQRTANANLDATMNSFDAVTKSTQAIATEIADYTRRSFENGTKTVENLLGVEVQTEYAKGAYEGYVTHASKLGELYANVAKEAFKWYQDFISKAAPVK
jgi:hypothetical protein